MAQRLKQGRPLQVSRWAAVVAGQMGVLLLVAFGLGLLPQAGRWGPGPIHSPIGPEDGRILLGGWMALLPLGLWVWGESMRLVSWGAPEGAPL